MPPQPPPPVNTAAAASPESDDSQPPSPEVPKPLKDVQQTLLSLEYALRNLSAVAADVQPARPTDPPQGRVAEKVNTVIEYLIELDKQKDDVTQNIPKDVLDDVDNNRNPNRTAKSRLENAAVQNQFVYSQILAIESFRGLLREALMENFPELTPHLETSRKELNQRYKDDVLSPPF